MKTWLADLPTTALVIAAGCVLAVLTALFFFAATISRYPIDDGNWTAWLAFVAATLGVGYAQFAKKRETYQSTYFPAPPAPHDAPVRTNDSRFQSPYVMEDC